MHHINSLPQGLTRIQQHTGIPPKGSKLRLTVQKTVVELIAQPVADSLPDQFSSSPLVGTGNPHYQQGACDLECLTHVKSNYM